MSPCLERATPNNKIVAFAIDPNSGVLTTVSGSPVTTGSDPLYIALVPVTRVGFQAFLYAANVQDGTISGFTADDNTGAGAPYTTSNGTLFFLYAADPQAQAVRAYTIDGNTGMLSPISGSPFPAGSPPALLTVAQDP
jgi:6-phosphogluconolactonase